MRGVSIAIFLMVSTLVMGQPSISWEKAIGGSQVDRFREVHYTSDGHMIFAGYSQSDDFDGSDVIYTGFGRTFVAGTSNSQDTTRTGQYDIWLQEVNTFGAGIWQKLLGGNSTEGGLKMMVTATGGILVVGTTWSSGVNVAGNHGLQDGWLVELAEVVSVPMRLAPAATDLTVFPNPAQDEWTAGFIVERTANLSLRVHDIAGRLIRERQIGKRSAGKHEEHFSDMDPGVYFVTLLSDNTVSAEQKLVVIF